MTVESAETWELEVFYDGDCPLCRREVRYLARRNEAGRLKLTDIAAPDFDASSVGKTWDELMARIHARHRDGTWLIGVDAFAEIYRAVGLGWIAALLRWPLTGSLARFGYRVFAKYRLRLTGRCATRSCAASGP